jgi:hypothetical protein
METPMKRMLPLLACLIVLGGCAMIHRPVPVSAPVPAAPVALDPGLRGADGTLIESLPFRQGISSVTVERLGRQQACVSRQGAALVTPAGPVEVYRMVCESGRIFMARCELRQCKPM